MTPDEAKNLSRKLKVPITRHLPDYLKDPANYEKIERALLETLASRHSHAEVLDWHKCKSCQNKVLNHKNMMRGLGFLTPAHYYGWKKIMHVLLKGTRDKLK